MTKTILITGASKGIGLCCALGLKERGHRVFATARTKEDLEKLAAQGLEALPLDLNDSESIKQLVSTLLQKTNNTLDVLINNAGYAQAGAIEDVSRAAMRAQFETNVFGPMELSNLLIPVMRQQGHGKIINISSILGIATMPYRGPYSASKFALESMTDTLRQELVGTGIDVILIEPGPIESNIVKRGYEIFKQTIASEQSPHRAVYERMLQKLSSKKKSIEDFSSPPTVVLKKIERAIDSHKPKARYRVTLSAHILAYLKYLLPTRAMDWVVSLPTRRKDLIGTNHDKKVSK